MREAITLTDGYKLDHRRQYPEGTEYVYSNWTPRSNKFFPEAEDGVVVFGIQYLIRKYLIDEFNNKFFKKSKEVVVSAFKRRVDAFLGPNQVGTKHIEQLYDLGYLPIEIKALPEGTMCPIRVPCMTIINTKKEFFWITNYLETLISTVLWLPMTSATTARLFKKRLIQHLKNTGIEMSNTDIGFLCHDFSMRGMAGVEAAVMSGLGHLTSFNGSETIPTNEAAEMYYGMDARTDLISSTVPATEHSVMCAGGIDDEFETFKRLITEVYPEGFVSIVSDTWDFWKVITDYMPRLKDVIMKRNGRVVIRPDSGDPVDIIAGLPNNKIVEYKGKKYYFKYLDIPEEEAKISRWMRHSNMEQLSKYEVSEAEIKGAYQCLLEEFGYTENKNAYKIMDSHIGMIYGDSITLERQEEIYKRLEAKRIAATNLVLGIGSYTYQYKTRDSLGFAMKATWCQINGEPKEIFKQPKTDSGMKNSLKGLILVKKDGDKLYAQDCVSVEEYNNSDSELNTVFKDGKLLKTFKLTEIRNNINNTL
jgi:nicotinamide phosphoribosyltransferase